MWRFTLQRVAFLLQIKPGKIEEYEEAHRHVWPEMILELQSAGISEYSIFRRGLQLFLTMHVADFEATHRMLAESEVNQRWQRMMASLFDAVPGKDASETLAMMQEVFYMPGIPDSTGN
jgi:L-rhamnose mutarotase